MSASLVGSEMCIRDRCKEGAGTRGRHNMALPRLAPSHLPSLGMPIGGPVSYTHLTLPTICSV
eukprot:5677443-Alexandrium_andersonii.AAC.1